MPDPTKRKHGSGGGSLLSYGADDDGRRTRPAPQRETEGTKAGKEPRQSFDPDTRARIHRHLNTLSGALADRSKRKAKGEKSFEDRVATEFEAELGQRHDKTDTAQLDRVQDRRRATGTVRAPASEDEWRPLIDPKAVFGGIFRSMRLIAAMAIAGALLGVIIALATPKKYDAAGDLLIDPRDIKLVDRELISSSLSMEAALAIVENQIRVLTSSNVVDKVVEELNLIHDPEFNGASGGFSLRGLISELRSILTRRDGDLREERQQAIAVENVLKSLHVSREGKTFVVTVSATTRDPEKSAVIVNKTIDVFLDISGEFVSSAAGRAAQELGAKLDELQVDVEKAERKVEAFKAENDLIDARGRLIGDDEILTINQQLANARARTIELNARAQSLRNADAGTVLSGALPEGINSGVITELRTQYARLLQEANRQAVQYGPRHPSTRTMESQLSGMREQIQSELRRIAASIQVELRRAVELEQKLTARLAALKARQVSVGEELVTLRQLEREAGAKRAVYESYLLRAKETGEQKDLNPANISVISRATPPLDPVGPSRAVISIAGLMGGLLLGIAVGGLRGAIDGFRSNGAPEPGGPQGPAPSKGVRSRGADRYPDYGREADPVENAEPYDRQPTDVAERIAALLAAEKVKAEHQDFSIGTPAAERKHVAGTGRTANAADVGHGPTGHAGYPTVSQGPAGYYTYPPPPMIYPGWPPHPNWASPGAMPAPPAAYYPATPFEPPPFNSAPAAAPGGQAAPARKEPEFDESDLDEIREGLREVRGALHDLVYRRMRRTG